MRGRVDPSGFVFLVGPVRFGYRDIGSERSRQRAKRDGEDFVGSSSKR